MLVTLATRTFTPEPTAAALRLGALARALAAGGDRVRVLTSRLAPSVARDSRQSGDGGVGAGEGCSLISVRRAPVLRDRTGAVRGYVSYMSFDIPLVARLLAGPRPDVVVSEPPPTTGVAVRIACAVRRVPYVYYCADIVSDAAALAGVPGIVVRTVAGLESFALRGAQRVIAVSDGVAGRARDLGARDVTVVPNGVRVPDFVAASPPEGFPACDGPVFVYAGTVAQWLAPEIFVDAFERARASATLASLRPGGYDYAYPTKILASLAQGTPVIYAGPGQAARDVAEGGLGVACGLDVDEIAEAMVALASGGAPWAGHEGVRAWVREHRSVVSSSAAAAAVVRSALA